MCPDNLPNKYPEQEYSFDGLIIAIFMFLLAILFYRFNNILKKITLKLNSRHKMKTV